MPGSCDITVWLFLFAAFGGVRVSIIKQRIYSRVEFTGENIEPYINDSSLSVEWNKINKQRCQCLLMQKQQNQETIKRNYSQCCGKAHFYLENNTLILENVTAQDQGDYEEKIVTGSNRIRIRNFTLIVEDPQNMTGKFKSEKESHKNTTGENLSPDDGAIALTTQTGLSSGLSLLGILGLSITLYFLCKYHHRDRQEADNKEGLYEEVAEAEEVTPLPYVYTDFIEPQDGALNDEDFGYSEVGPPAADH